MVNVSDFDFMNVRALPVEAKIGWVVAWLIAPGVSMQNFYKMAVRC